jgi:hypothetical protein
MKTHDLVAHNTKKGSNKFILFSDIHRMWHFGEQKKQNKLRGFSPQANYNEELFEGNSGSGLENRN